MVKRNNYYKNKTSKRPIADIEKVRKAMESQSIENILKKTKEKALISKILNIDPKQLEVIKYTKSLALFTKSVWPIIEPTTELVWNWHLDAICLHLEAITKRQIKNLIIQIPPRSSKSTICSVVWPVWSWLVNPSARFLTGSYAENLSVRDTLRSRRIMQTAWFKNTFPSYVQLTSDQNRKERYENTATGYRIAITVSTGATGEGGDYTLVDDPHDVTKAMSEEEREKAILWYMEAFYNRLNDITKGGRVVVGQRFHTDDLIGYLLQNDKNNEWTNLCLPEMFVPERRCMTSIWVDPRQKLNELLRPKRLPLHEIKLIQNSIGPYAFSAQYQQDPIVREGGYFPRECLEKNIVSELPPPEAIDAYIRYWDKAGSDNAGAYTVGVLMARSKEGKYYIVDIIRGRWNAFERNEIIRNAASEDTLKCGYVKIFIEQEPGSGGKESAEISIRDLEGFDVEIDKVTGDKLFRASPFASQVQRENVYLLDSHWISDYLEELQKFPKGKYKDQVDASSGAYNKLALNQIGAWGDSTFDNYQEKAKSLVDKMYAFGNMDEQIEDYADGTSTITNWENFDG